MSAMIECDGKKTELEVIITSWNTAAITCNCLESLFAEVERNEIASVIWVVDNNSSDGSASLIRRRFPTVRLIQNDSNVGFARANNQALRQVVSPFVLLLNSDTIVLARAVARLLSFLKENPNVAAVGPRLVGTTGIPQKSFSNLPPLAGEFPYLLANHFYPFSCLFYPILNFHTKRRIQPAHPRRIEVLSAACLMIRKSAFDQVGHLAEDYFLFSEENDLFFRMKRAGLISYHLPDSTVIHLIGASRAKRANIDSEVNYIRSRIIYFSKYYPLGGHLLRRMYILFFKWSLFVARAVSFLKHRESSEYVSMYEQLLATLRARA